MYVPELSERHLEVEKKIFFPAPHCYRKRKIVISNGIRIPPARRPFRRDFQYLSFYLTLQSLESIELQFGSIEFYDGSWWKEVSSISVGSKHESTFQIKKKVQFGGETKINSFFIIFPDWFLNTF